MFCACVVIGFETENDLLRAYANSSSGMYAETEDGELSSTVLAGIVFTSMLEENGTRFPDNIEVGQYKTTLSHATLRSVSYHRNLINNFVILNCEFAV